MDLQEKRQLDLARQVAKVKAHTRPWRAIIALVLAVLAPVWIPIPAARILAPRTAATRLDEDD